MFLKGDDPVRRFLSVVLVLVVAFSLVMLVSAKSFTGTRIVSGSADVVESVDDTPHLGQYHYEKTVIIYYTSFDDVPDCIEFAEYKKEHDAEFSGILYVQEVTRVENMKYEAVFCGDLTEAY